MNTTLIIEFLGRFSENKNMVASYSDKMHVYVVNDFMRKNSGADLFILLIANKNCPQFKKEKSTVF